MSWTHTCHCRVCRAELPLRSFRPPPLRCPRCQHFQFSPETQLVAAGVVLFPTLVLGTVGAATFAERWLGIGGGDDCAESFAGIAGVLAAMDIFALLLAGYFATTHPRESMRVDHQMSVAVGLALFAAGVPAAAGVRLLLAIANGLFGLLAIRWFVLPVARVVQRRVSSEK